MNDRVKLLSLFQDFVNPFFDPLPCTADFALGKRNCPFVSKGLVHSSWPEIHLLCPLAEFVSGGVLQFLKLLNKCFFNVR